MFSKPFIAACVVVLGSSSLVAAQNEKLRCDLEKGGDWSCPPNPALGTSVTCDFTKGECDAFKPDEWTDATAYKYGKEGAELSVKKRFQAPTLLSKKYILFGRVDAKVRCARGAGVVTSAVLLSDVGDEIDLEWIGSKDGVQSNYFGKNNDSTWDRGAHHLVDAPASKFHTYGIEWTKAFVKWYVDGAVVRTVNYQDAVGGANFPQTPSQIRLGPWAPESKGSQEWAGGAANFSEAPFVATYQSVTVVDYAGGDQPAQGGIKEYVISDKKASFETVKIVKDDGSVAEGESETALDKAEASGATSKAQVGSKTTASIATSETQSTSSEEQATTASSSATSKSNATATSSSERRPSSTSTASIPSVLSKSMAAPKFLASDQVLYALVGLAAAQLWL